ncbi:unnamed protein product [Rotaria sordida]|uniref:Alpha/beta hydrolase fold-3 domain-containing protein n=1 Tax=Rotaria sordida TaxID=392033 RepID=A0A815F1F0_9BILA|nr:unnamed protein product [Rotaria sordida]
MYRNNWSILSSFFMDPRFSDETRAFLNVIMQAPPSTNDIDITTKRQQTESLSVKMNEKLIDTFKGTLQEQKVAANSTGWTLCSRKTHQAMVNMLADATKAVWISVEYRLGPEHKFPIWWNDAYEVAQHILENKQSYGVDPSAKVGLAGDSAGGALSATICRALKNIDFQVELLFMPLKTLSAHFLQH